MRRIAAIAAFSMSLSGCATLFGEKNKMVRIESTPSGASVLLNGMPYGKTPTSVELTNLMASNMVTLKLEGYDEISRPIATSLQPVAFLNLLNLLCWGIDLATGNVMKIDTKYISVDLEKKQAFIETNYGTRMVDLTKSQSCPKT